MRYFVSLIVVTGCLIVGFQLTQAKEDAKLVVYLMGLDDADSIEDVLLMSLKIELVRQGFIVVPKMDDLPEPYYVMSAIIVETGDIVKVETRISSRTIAKGRATMMNPKSAVDNFKDLVVSMKGMKL